MSWTVLRVVEAGVVLREAHAMRLGAMSGTLGKAYDDFCANAAPGIYGVGVEGDSLQVNLRGAPMLHDGQPVRYRVSPMLAGRGLIAKPAAPSPYDAVRLRSHCTLLTDETGQQLIESCVGVLVGWDGERLLLASERLPRVRSMSESAVRAGLPFREHRFHADDAMPLAVMNAVSGLCRPLLEKREPFRATAGNAISGLFADLTRR